MQRISGYIISLFLCFSAICSAQDTIRYPINEMKGVRIGVDLSTIPFMFIEKFERVGMGATADVHIKGNFFGVAEAGWLRVSLDKPDFHYRSDGFYARVGTDYNLLKPRRPFTNDIVYGGVRYCFSTLSHQADRVNVPGYFWGDGSGLSMPKNTMNVHWMELLLGVKAEVITNLYISLNFRLKFLIVSPKEEYSTPHNIPGYGNGSSNFVVGINYFLSYNIHF